MSNCLPSWLFLLLWLVSHVAGQDPASLIGLVPDCAVRSRLQHAPADIPWVANMHSNHVSSRVLRTGTVPLQLCPTACAQTFLFKPRWQDAYNSLVLSKTKLVRTRVMALLSLSLSLSLIQADIVAAALSNQICDGYPIESRAKEVNTAAIACAAVTFPVVILRCLARLMVTKRLWWDDWTALVAMVISAKTTA